MSKTTKQECDAPELEPVGTEIGVATGALPPIKKPFKRTLRCELTESQLVEVARDICKTQREIDDLTEAKRASAASYAERIKKRTQEREDLMQKFSSREEDRMVECEWWLDYPEAGMKTAIRKDTGVAIGVEAMTTEDRDQDLPGIAEPELKPAEDAEVVEDDFPEENESEDSTADAEEIAENARVDAIIDGLKDDEEEPEGDF